MSKITALLQRLLALLPSRHKADAATDLADDNHHPADTDTDTTADAAASPDHPDDNLEAVIERARQRLIWKKRIIIGIPALLLVIIIAAVAALFLGGSDEAPPTLESSPDTPLTAPVDPQERAKTLEAELKKMEQERNALLIEKNALAERNRKLQEAAARNAAKAAATPRSRASLPTKAGAGGTASTTDTANSTPYLSDECTIGGDAEAAGELLKRCVEEFNAASEGR
jgi:hypothetical protein